MGTRYERKGIAVDLDGTLVRGNTLHLLMRWLAGHHPVGACPRLLWAACRRAVGVDSHVDMKGRVLSIARSHMSVSEVELFARSLAPQVNQCVLALIRKYDYTILATAAPDFYACAIAWMLGCDVCVSSRLERVIREGQEMRGVSKRDSVKSLARQEGVEVTAVVTDHKDDLPLLRLPGVSRFLVNPSRELCMTLDAESLPYEVLTTE